MNSLKASEVIFHHHGDYSGEVIMVVNPDKVEEGPNGKLFVTLPFSDVLSLVVDYMKHKTIGNIELMSDSDFVAWATAGTTVDLDAS